MRRKTRKVFVGMSGGVDSSVAAYLLKKQGYDVVGIHLRCWNVNGCDEKEATDARLVAEKLSIPFYVLDMEDEYKKRVVDYMIDEYKQGLTPNPDVMCNKEIKFGLFLDKAIEMGADYVATGHYARNVKKGKQYFIYEGVDKDKDQSYFLWTLSQDKLSRILFPLGKYTKKKVRKIAKGVGLHIADKKDSQGICFVGKVTLEEFLGKYLEEKEGVVKNTNGEVIGKHHGAHFYTIGQRHGLGVALNEPHYVVDKNTKENVVILAKEENEDFDRKSIDLINVNLNLTRRKQTSLFVRTRYRQKPIAAKLEENDGKWSLFFSKPIKFVAPGQSAVIYDRTGRLLGGGVIS